MRRFVTLSLLFLLATTTACREQTKEELFQQGMAFVEAGNHQAAVSLFKNALDKDPNYIDARLHLGIAYLRTQKTEKAEKELEKVLLQAPNNQIVSIRLAEIYVSTNRPEQAIQQLDSLHKAAPNNPEVLLLLASSHAMSGSLPVAEELFRKSLLIQPQHAPTQLGLAQLLFVLGRADEGDRLINEVITQEPGNTDAYYLMLRRALTGQDRTAAIESLEKIRSINPDDIGAAYLLAMLYLDTGQIDTAQQIAEDITARSPGHPASDRIKGVAFYQRGEFGAAIEKLQKSLNAMPDLPGFYLLGLASYRLGQLEQALSSFQRALDKSPGHEPSRLMVAQTLLKQGRVADCMQQANLIIERNPSNAGAYNLLGSAYLIQGDYDLAMEHIDRAIQINPDLAQAHLKKGLFNLAVGNKQQGELDITSAVNAAPEILNTRLLLANYHLRQHNYPLAVQTLEKGLTISPDSAVIYNLLAAAKFGQNQLEEAVECLEKAKALKPGFFAPYFNLANYYVARKEYQPALLEYQAVLQVSPDNVPAMLKAAPLYELLEDDAAAESFYAKAAATQNPQGYFALASFQIRKRQGAAALQTLKSGYDALPDNADMITAYGGALKAAGKLDEAILVYAHLEEMRPGAGKPFLLGAHLLKGDFAAAEEMADRAIAEQPASAEGYLFQAAIHEKRSEWSLAEKAMQRGLAATGNNQTLGLNLARLYTRRGANDDALKIYDDILREKPNLVPVLFAKAAILDLTGDKKQAQGLYESILATDENYVPALNNLAMLMLDVYTEDKRALELASKGFRLKPNDPRIIDTLGYALFKNGQVEKAITFLEKAASSMPEEATIQIHLARAYKTAGRSKEAIASLSVIDQARAQEEQIQEAKALMNELN